MSNHQRKSAPLVVMNSQCYICNGDCKTNIHMSRFVDKLWNNRKIIDLVSELVEKPVVAEKLHSDQLCSECYETCILYETYNQKLNKIKADTKAKFKNTLTINNLASYDLNNASPIKVGVKRFDGKTVVVPASKLMPCPPEMLAKVGKALSMGTTIRNQSPIKIKAFTPTFNKIDSQAVLTPIKKSQAIAPTTDTLTDSIGQSISNLEDIQTLTLDVATIESMGSIDQSSILTTSTNNMTFETMNFSTLPTDFLEKNMDGDRSDHQSDDEHVDDGQCDVMEIDESCKDQNDDNSNGFIQVYIENDKNTSSCENKNFLDLNLLTGGSGDESQNKYIVSKLEILSEKDDDDDDDEGEGDDGGEQHTIVMDGENGSILRVVSGNKLMYGDEEISLVLPQNDDARSQDSNDESQIELQVSGDEETANAIIAAAQEQGGAFIKVGSGEMYRVESVESKKRNQNHDVDDDEDEQQLTDYLVRLVNGKFSCLMCEKDDDVRNVLGDAESTMRHLKLRHGATLYICRLCHHITRKRSSYTAHMEKHTNEVNKSTQNAVKNKIHECNVCQKRYSSKTLLSEHMNIHNGTKPHTCEICNKSFVSKYTYQAHLKTHTERPRPFKCAQCGKSFLSNQNLWQHTKTHTGVKNFLCKICGKGFGSQHNLEIHGVVHSGQKPFVCDTCSKGFARKAELTDHIRTHTGERPFSCVTCGASFSQRSNLLSHRRATHLDDRRYACDVCHKKFKRRRLLEYHVKASHTGERPLSCAACGAAFVYPEHYKKHMRIHSGEKPFMCEVCGKSFNSRDNRNTHRFVHSDKKPYECLVCSAGYMRKNLLYAHMNSTGHLAESIVVNQPRVTKVTDHVVTTESLVVDSIKMKPELNISDTMFTTEELELEIPGKSLEVIGDDSQVQVKTEADFLEVITAEQLERAQIVANDENGEMVRLVQIQLPDGNNGWVAIP